MTAGSDAQRLSDLRAKWGRHWRVWRARGPYDQPGERTGDWCATRLDPAAGPDPTVIRDTADHLNDALHIQQQLIAQGAKQLTVAEAGPE